MARLNGAIARSCLAIAIATLATGCNRSDRLAVVPAVGTLLLQQANGKQTPIAGAHIVFIPVAGDGRYSTYPSARTGPDGTFRLGTFGTDDGAPEGEYVVTVEWHDRAKPEKDVLAQGETDRGPDKLRGAFADRNKSPLRATVAAGRELIVVVPVP
jgi:hypothetical protein